jgi:hypothetical protein
VPRKYLPKDKPCCTGTNLFAARCATGPLVIAGLAAMRRQLTAPLSAACPGGYSTRLLADADLKAVELGRLRR